MNCYEPINHPNLDESAYVQHKIIPEPIKPQSVVPEKFLNAVEHPKSKDAQDLEKTLEGLNSVNQKGSGVNEETEKALNQPIKVRYPIVFVMHLSNSYRNYFQITQLELRNLLDSSSNQKLSKDERKRLRELLQSSEDEEDEKQGQGASKPLKPPRKKKTKKKSNASSSATTFGNFNLV